MSLKSESELKQKLREREIGTSRSPVRAKMNLYLVSLRFDTLNTYHTAHRMLWVPLIMTEDKFDISWNTFDHHLRSTRKHLFTTKKFCDVTLVSDSMAPFQGHKSVLSSASKVFETLLDIDQGPSCTILYLRGIQSRELASLLEFIYLGQTFVSQDKLEDFAKAANELNIEGLSNALNQKESDDTEDKERSFEEEQNDVRAPPTVQLLRMTDLKHEQSESTKVEISEAEAEQGAVSQTKEFKIVERYDARQGIFVQTKELKIEQEEDQSNLFEKVLPEGNILCTQCDKVLRDRHSFKRHFHAVHARVKEKCPECGKLFHRHSLKRHKEMIHEGIKYPCEYCAYIAPQKNAIKMHTKTFHNKELGSNHRVYQHTKYTASKSN